MQISPQRKLGFSLNSIWCSITILWANISNIMKIRADTILHESSWNLKYKLTNLSEFSLWRYCKTTLVIFNCWFLMYFLYFPNYAPSKPSEMDNYWIIMNFFGKYISKCTYRMKKRTHVSAYRLLSNLNNKPVVFISSRGSPCSILPFNKILYYINKYTISKGYLAI